MPRYAEAIGLDLGSRSAKVAHVVRRRGVCTVAATARVDLPLDGPERRRALQRLAESRGWRDVPCVAVLRGDALVLRALDVPPSDPRSMRQVMSVEMKEVESLSATETLSHCAKMPGPNGHRRALLAVTRSDAVESILETHNEAGLEVADVVPAGVALLNTYSRFLNGRPGTAMLVDLARDTTDVAVVSGHSLLFSRSLPFGADALLGADTPGKSLDTWSTEIQSFLTLYRSRFQGPEHEVLSVIVSGGGAAVQGLTSNLAAVLGLEVGLMEDLPIQQGERDVAFFASAVGLALAGLGEAPVESSLLPAPLKEKQMLRGQIRYWVLSAAAALLAMTFLIMRSYRELEREKQQLAAEQQHLDQRRALADELGTYRADIEALQTKVGSLEIALRNGHLLRAVIDAVADAKAPDDWITLIADSYSYFAGTTPDEEAEGVEPHMEMEPLSPAALVFEQIVVEGYTPVEDLSTVRAMIEALREHPAIEDVDLLGDDRLREDSERDERWGPAECSLFAIEITVPQP